MKKSKRILISVIIAVVIVVLSVIIIISIINGSKRKKDGVLNRVEPSAAPSVTEAPATSTPAAMPTATLTPTVTPEPTSSPTPTVSPSPTSTPTSTPTVTPEPTATPTPMPVVDASAYSTVLGKDYSEYNSTRYNWWLEYRNNHLPPAAGAAFNISKFNALYLDTEAEARGDKVVYIAFDCGYELGYLDGMLDDLKARNIKAIFFVTSQTIRECPETLKRMKAEGHLVGNHTVNHKSLSDISVDTLVYEVLENERLYEEATGYKIDKFIRPPQGAYSERSLKVLQDLDYTTVFWSLAYVDWDPASQPGKDYVINFFNRLHHNGMVTLVHSVAESNAQALGTVLDLLIYEGYRFGTLDELVK